MANAGWILGLHTLGASSSLSRREQTSGQRLYGSFFAVISQSHKKARIGKTNRRRQEEW